jgi:hypothetical protein
MTWDCGPDAGSSTPGGSGMPEGFDTHVQLLQRSGVELAIESISCLNVTAAFPDDLAGPELGLAPYEVDELELMPAVCAAAGEAPEPVELAELLPPQAARASEPTATAIKAAAPCRRLQLRISGMPGLRVFARASGSEEIDLWARRGGNLALRAACGSGRRAAQPAGQ